MQLPHPHIFTSDRMMAHIDSQQQAAREGPITHTVSGHHSLWIAEVPFITSDTPKDFAYESEQRLANVLKRQQRFLYDLAQLHEGQATFELRLVSWPQNNGPTRVGIVFLGKVFHEDLQISRRFSLALWDKFSALFPREAPFSYPLIPVRDESERTSQQTHSFASWYQPLPFELLEQPECIVELRKYEDWPTMGEIGGVLYGRDYIPHPFEPALDYSALGRLFQTLAHQRSICMVNITLRPQQLTDQEIVQLYETLSWHQRLAEGKITIKSPLSEVLQTFDSDILPTYLRTRADISIKVYETLIRERDNLFTVRLQVVGFPSAQHELVEALGSEMTADVESSHPSRWARVIPSANEAHWARFNTQWLEFATWGTSPLIQQAPTLTRFRQLATVAEAMGAFRLPIASSGGLAGIEVRDEPFFLPTQIDDQHTSSAFGLLQDHGVNTDIPFLLPHNVFTRLIALLGENGVARTSTLRTLLQAVNTDLPWVLIRGGNTDPADSLAELGVQPIRIDASSGQLPFSIQPFFRPPTVALPTFVDALQRVLTITCKLEPTSAIILRQALRSAYQQIQEDNEREGLSNLIHYLLAALSHIQAPSDLLATIETQVILPLQDLSTTTGMLFDTTPAANQQWTFPTLIEVGWVGSEQSRAIVCGCLWAFFALKFAQSSGKANTLRGLVGIEEACTIFEALPDALSHSSSPTTSLAQQLALLGVCTLLIEEQAERLGQGITNHIGAIIITHNSNEIAQECAAKMIGASPRQIARLRILQPHEVIVAIPGTNPVLTII